MFPTAATARPVDPLLDKALAARVENAPSDFVYGKVPANVLRDGNTAVMQRLAEGELNRLNPDKLLAWQGGNVEGIDGVKLDPFVLTSTAYMRGVQLGMLGVSRAQNVDLIAVNTYTLAELMRIKRERLLGTLLSTTANWASGSAAVPAGQKWTASGGDPVKLIKNMADAVGGRDVVMSRTAYNAFIENTKVLSDRAFTQGSDVLTDEQAMSLLGRYGLRLHVSRARWYDGTTYTPAMTGDFVWLGDLSEQPVAVSGGGNTFRVTKASVVRVVEELRPPPDSNRGRAGYVLGGVNNGLYFHQFANNAAEATQANMGYSEGLSVAIKSNGIVKIGLV